MRHSIIVYTVSCILIGLDSASILYAGPIMRIEAFRPKAWEPLSKVSRLTPEEQVSCLTPEERDSIRTKIDPFSFDYLKEPGWADQCAVAVIPLSEQREETRKDLVHLQRDEKGKLEEEPPDEKKRDEDELSKLLKRITGTLHVSFDFQTEPTDQPSIIQVQFRGRHVLLGGTSGKKTFSKSMELPVGVNPAWSAARAPHKWAGRDRAKPEATPRKCTQKLFCSANDRVPAISLARQPCIITTPRNRGQESHRRRRMLLRSNIYERSKRVALRRDAQTIFAPHPT